MSEKTTLWKDGKLGIEGGLRARRPLAYKGLRPYLATSDVQDSDILPSEYVEFYTRPARAGLELAVGDVLQAKMKDTNKPLYVDEEKHGWLASTGFSQFTPNASGNNPKYFFHYLSSESFFRKKDTLCVGSTQQAIAESDLASIDLQLPPIPEQSGIAEILDCIAGEIKLTTQLIRKYESIKAGLMHDLFTRGVTADGKLRPPREQVPELYQETPIGWIPKEWDLERCGNLCTRICVGIVIQPTQYYVVDGIPAFRSANVREDGIDPSNFVYISPSANTLLAKSQVKAGDILSVRTGYPGTSAVVPMEFHGSNCIDILISSPGDRINSEFLCDWINSSFGKEQVLRQQGGMAQQHFNVGEMRELLVAIPSKEEQIRIRERAISVNGQLRLEKDMLKKLHQQKLGLMHDLLTGKVRVAV